MGDYPFAPAPTNGEKILVAPPTGLTAADTPAVAGAIARLTATGGGQTIQFQDGTYQIDTNSAVIRSCSNFAVTGTGATIISAAPNRAGLPNNCSGDLFVIADSTDFRVTGITFDMMRDTVAPLTPLTVIPATGQPSVTVAAGNGSRYVVGQSLQIYGGLGSADQALFNTTLVILSITPGGGSGGGDLITFTTNITTTFTVTSGTVFSDGFGPYAYAGVYLTPYQTLITNSVAGRSLYGEDQQNALHLLGCQRFQVSRCEARNMWESGIKTGTGFAPTSLTTDPCNQGDISQNIIYHGYDQGVSVWVCQTISVSGNSMNAAGWSGCSLTSSDNCTVVGNKSLNSIYSVPASLGGGNGVACEGGSRNSFTGNIIINPNQDGIRIDIAGGATSWAIAPGSAPTLTAFVEAGTVAGTSIAVSATGVLSLNAPYSIIDGVRTERINISAIVDGTHIRLSANLRFSHAAGVFIYQGVAQDNIIEGNTVIGPVSGNGVINKTAVRSLIKNNSISGYGIAGAANFSGVALNSTAVGPGAVTLGGQGSVIEGNDIGGGTSAAINTAISDHLVIVNNTISGVAAGTPPVAAVNLAGVTDSICNSNRISENNGQGIICQVSGGVNIARLAIVGNEISRCANEGIIVLTGSALTITGNNITSCGGHAGIDLRDVTYSTVADNLSLSNQNDGIELEQTSTGCLYNRIIGNTCRDDGTGTNMTTNAAWTQQNGIIEAGALSNLNLFVGNEVDSNAVAQLTTVGAGTIIHYNIVSGVIGG